MTIAPRVLFVSHEVDCGGAETSLLELMSGLDRQRFTPLLACSGPGELADRAAAHGLDVYVVPMRHRSRLRKLTGLAAGGRRLTTLIEDHDVAVVHANTIHAGYYSLVGARRSRRRKVVWHVRDMTYPWPAKVAARRADSVIANSRATAATIGGSRTRVVYNGVDPSFFAVADTGAEVRAELGLPPHTALVGMVGRLDRWKGHIDFLQAASRIPDAHFAIVGAALFDAGNTYRDELIALTERIGLTDRVHFLGQRRDVPRLLAAFDVVAHPSNSPEPFGRAVVEALATGTPVVGTNAGGIPEIIEDGVHGYLIPPNDAAALADRIAAILATDDRGATMGTAGRAMAGERFTLRQHVDAVQAIYDELLADRLASATDT